MFQKCLNDNIFQYLQNFGVFLNIHKRCANTGPVTFRNSLLLSTNSVVVSARCHPMDEKIYEGIILFVNDVANITRASVEAHLRTRNMSLFFERFDARTILQNAGLVRGSRFAHGTHQRTR